MIIRGGQVFIMEDDCFAKATITDARIIIDVPEGSSMTEMSEYLEQRLGFDSYVSGCTFTPLQKWAKRKSEEATRKAKSEVHLKDAPIMQRIRKFLRLGAAS